MNQSSYTNIKEVSQRIQLISELAYTLKTLYSNVNTADPAVIRKYENDFSTTKMNIIEWLKEPANYELFKASPDAKKSLLFKQTKEGYYNNEIGLETTLKDKIYRDFLENFNLSSPEELLTENELRSLRASQKNENEGINPQSNTFEEENKILLNVYSKERVYEKSWVYVRNNLPEKELLDREAQSLYATIEKNPHYLKDSPNHFLKNRGSYKGQAPTLGEVFDTIQQSSVGSPSAKEKIKAYLKLFNDFTENKPEQESILETREKSTNKNQLGKTAKISPN